jgi:surface protein
MKHVSSWLILFLSITLFLSFDSAASSNNVCNIVEVVKNVNVRTKATKNSRKVGYLRVGQQYVETEQQGNWRRIWYHNKQRWVYGKGYLQSTSGECVQIANTKTGHVNVRAEANKTSIKVGAAPESSWWALQNMEGNWAKVWYASTPAYIYKKYAVTPTPAAKPFKTRWNMTYEDGLVITLKANPQYDYNYTVDWGDGTVDENVMNTIKHSYAQPGEYVISISGQFPHLFRGMDFYDVHLEPRLKSIVQWGDIEWQSMEWSFAYMSNLTHIEITQSPDLTQVESMANMFRSNRQFHGDISDWDVSNVTDMSGMFEYSRFNGDISDWDVSNVTDMSGMFENSRFNSDISQWDVSNVRDMRSMFSYSQFNSDISQWDVGNVTDMGAMFGKSQFNGDISDWDVSNVTDMSVMFAYSSFSGDMSQWDVGNVTDMSGMFVYSEFNGDVSQWDVSNVTDMSGMFEYSRFNGDISDWDVSNVTNMGSMFWRSQFNGDISQWDVGNVTNMESMFWYSKFNGDISQWDVSNVTNMGIMFYKSQFNGDISQWDVSNVYSMGAMLYNETFSQANYDKLLIGWSQLTLQRNVSLDVKQHYSSAGQAGRDILINRFGWGIDDKGLRE